MKIQACSAPNTRACCSIVSKVQHFRIVVEIPSQCPKNSKVTVCQVLARSLSISTASSIYFRVPRAVWPLAECQPMQGPSNDLPNHVHGAWKYLRLQTFQNAVDVEMLVEGAPLPKNRTPRIAIRELAPPLANTCDWSAISVHTERYCKF